jgi:penicillin amidase
MSRSRTVHLTGILILCLVIIQATGCPTSRFISYRSSPDYPQDQTETLRIPGLQQTVTVYIDQAGITHIDAMNEIDLARATGFYQARNRFFAMDLLRRFARGRMSELVGEQKILEGTTVEFDISMRGWGMNEGVREDVAGLDPETRAIMEAFVGGVNEAISRYLPLEYRLLQVTPDPWTMEDCFAVGRLNAWGVTHNWQQELSRLLLAMSVGMERASRIYGHDWWQGGTTLPSGDPVRELPPAMAPELADWFPLKPYAARPGKRPNDQERGSTAQDAMIFTAASNSWVVGGDRSASGMPIQANDPHLTHMLPSLMYQQHLRAPGLDVIGAGIAGLPYVLAGHNGHVAWGTTSAVGDAVDLYVERRNPENPDEVLAPDGWQQIEKQEQVVRIRQGQRFDEKRFVLRRTRNGALLNDMYPHLFPVGSPLVAVRWATRGVSSSIQALRGAARARTVEELREALLGLATPVSAWTAADTSGAIAFFVTGSLPVRDNHLGTFPVPGWLDKYQWSGWTRPEDMPFAVSREGGFFAHANNLVQDPRTGAVFLHVDAAPSYRYDRIVELLDLTKPHTIQTMADIQMDVRLNRAKRLLPSILKDLKLAKKLKPIERKALNLLAAWDLEAASTSAATSIFFMLYREAIIEALHDELDPAAYRFMLSQRYSTNVADLWFEQATHPVWDDRSTWRIETRRDVLIRAFSKAVARLRKDLGPVPEEWRWGKMHFLQIRHAFGGRKALSKFMNLRSSAVGGGLDSVWKSHFDLGNEKDPFAVVAGPSYRQIIDLSDIHRGFWVSDTGVSGWPGSPQYGDQHESWKRGAFVPMLSDWDDIKSLSEVKVLLSPPIEPETVVFR